MIKKSKWLSQVISYTKTHMISGFQVILIICSQIIPLFLYYIIWSFKNMHFGIVKKRALNPQTLLAFPHPPPV